MPDFSLLNPDMGAMPPAGNSAGGGFVSTPPATPEPQSSIMPGAAEFQMIPTPPPKPVNMRSFTDVRQLKDNVFSRALQAAQEIKPISNKTHTLSLRDVDYADPDHYTLAQQKQAILRRETLGRRLRGTWELTDNATGKVVDKKSQTLARVPFFTQRGTTIHNGSEYVVINQQRLKPGIFTREQQNGDLEAHANVAVGSGTSHRYYLDPANSKFFLKVGQAKLPMLPLLRALGASNEQLKAAWGREIFAANDADDDPKGLGKIYDKFSTAEDKRQNHDDNGKRTAVQAAFARMQLDGEVNSRTLGKYHTGMSLDTVLDITKKLIGVSRREQDPDDRDHMANQQVIGPEDMIAERLSKDHGHLRRTALFKASLRGNLGHLPAGYLNKQIESVLIGSGLGQALEEVNAMEVLDKRSKITRMGEGGIGSTTAIPSESRNVLPSHLGFIDPLRTVESLRAGVDLYMAQNAMKGDDGRIYNKFVDFKTGELVDRTPEQMANSTILFSGEAEKAARRGRTRAAGMKNGKMGYVKLDEVDYVMKRMEDGLSPLSNMLPYKNNSKGQRLGMGARMSVAADTRIVVIRQDGRAFSGRIADYVWQTGDQSLSIDKVSCQLAWKPVRSVVRHVNSLRMYRVTLKSGREVVATADHSFVTVGADGSLVKVHTQDLAVGVPIPCAGTMPVDDFSAPGQWSVPAGSKHNAWPEQTFDLNFSLGWMHGFYLSEGWCQKHDTGHLSGVGYSAMKPELRQRVLRFFARRGVYATEKSSRPDKQLSLVMVNWKQLALKMEQDFGNGSYSKKLPDWVLAAPRCYRRGLIAGYLAGDVTAVSRKDRTTSYVCGGSRSKILRDGLVDVFLSIGICVVVNEFWADTGPGGSTVMQYMLRVRAEQQQMLPRTGRIDKDAAVSANQWGGKRSSDRFPMFAAAHALVLSCTKRGSVARQRCYSDQHDRRSMTAAIGYGGDSVVHAWLRSGVWWDRIKSVEEVPADNYTYVYDLDMEDNVFACNGGVFVHNTTQALPLIDAEAPLVQSAIPDGSGRSYEEDFGQHAGVVRAEQAGRVLAVTPDSMTVRQDDGTTKEYELYNNMPSNRKSSWHNTPLAKPGDRVNVNSVLAKSNYTDDNGTVALGKNARVAYMLAPHGSSNYEDAIAISQSFADRMQSNHAYQHDLELSDGLRTGKKAFLSLYPGKFSAAQLGNFTDDGIIKPGTKVSYGDPLILGAMETKTPPGKVHKKGQSSFKDSSQLWDHHSEGEVTDVVQTSKGMTVIVKATAKSIEADKLSGRYGDKGVCTIVPDERMPTGEDGKPFEVLLNPLSLISRSNASQAIEASLGKIAAVTGKPYKLEDFESTADAIAFTQAELKKHGMKDTETVTDPETGRKIPNVFTGNRFIMKLAHMAEDKGQGRGLGSYTSAGEPSRSGAASSKRVGLLDSNSLLSHSALNVLSDITNVKGQQNDNYWLSFMQGNTPAKPKVPMIYEKFVSELKASGINVVPQGNKLQIMAMTDKDTELLAEDREITSGDTVHGDEDLTPIAGGLFDKKLTGGHGGCFHPSTLVWTELGQLPIGLIVKERIETRVWSYCFDSCDFELKPIVSWFENRSDKPLVRGRVAQVVRLPSLFPRLRQHVIWGTAAHQIMQEGGVKQDLESVSSVLCAEQSLSYHQRQLVYGTLLGDGFVGEYGSYAAVHCSKQLGYLKFKYRMLREFVPGEIKIWVDSSGGCIREKASFRCRNHPELLRIRQECYPGGSVCVSQAWLDKIDEPGLAYWFFDDGHADRSKLKNSVTVSLSTHAYSAAGIKLLRDWLLTRWGLSTFTTRHNAKYADRDMGWMICMQGSNADRLLDLVAPYACKAMRYKFPEKPRSASCKRCGAEVGSIRRVCNACQIGEARACGNGKLPKGTRRLFGGTANLRAILNSGIVPPQAETGGLQQWRAREFSLGSRLKEVAADRHGSLSLVATPCEVDHPADMSYASARAVYDIEVEGNHNYFANGVLVSNSKWSYVKLSSPMPNPAFEEPIRKILGLTGPMFEKIIAGQEKLNGKTGTEAIQAALGAIKVDQAVELTSAQVKAGRGATRDAAIKKLNYLKSAQKLGIHPSEWMITKVPVLPATFRPISLMSGSGVPLISDSNYLYRELIDANHNLRDLTGQISDVGEERSAVYNSLKAVVGLGDPTQLKLRDKGIQGLLKGLLGTGGPKTGTLQRRLIGQNVDLIGRAVVTPNADLDMDSVGIPEAKAWDVYKNFVVRRLKRNGMPLIQAMREANDRTPLAKKELLAEMEDRPVILNRAPVWHKYGILALKPQLVKGNSIQTSPLINAGYNLDHDGDTMSYSIPVGDEARKEALEKMLPSRNLLSTKDMKSAMHMPSKEMAAGLYQLTSGKSDKSIRTFATRQDALNALQSGEIDPGDKINVLS